MHPLISRYRQNGTSTMTLVGSGDREVYSLPGHDAVLKVDDHSNQNSQEVEAWRSAPPNVKAHFARILDHTRDRELVVQERADREATQREADVLWRRLDATDWACNDFRPDNVGVFGGTVKMIDYESCRKRRFMRDWMKQKWKDASPQ